MKSIYINNLRRDLIWTLWEDQSILGFRSSEGEAISGFRSKDAQRLGEKIQTLVREKKGRK